MPVSGHCLQPRASRLMWNRTMLWRGICMLIVGDQLFADNHGSFACWLFGSFCRAPHSPLVSMFLLVLRWFSVWLVSCGGLCRVAMVTSLDLAPLGDPLTRHLSIPPHTPPPPPRPTRVEVAIKAMYNIHQTEFSTYTFTGISSHRLDRTWTWRIACSYCDGGTMRKFAISPTSYQQQWENTKRFQSWVLKSGAAFTSPKLKHFPLKCLKALL